MKRRALFWGCLFMLCGMVMGSLGLREPLNLAYFFVPLLLSSIGFYIYFQKWRKALFFGLLFLFLVIFIMVGMMGEISLNCLWGRLHLLEPSIDSPVFEWG